MKFQPQPSHKRKICHAFMRRDLVVVIALVFFGFIAFAFLSAFNAAKGHAIEMNCASNLKQVGLAFVEWEQDNGDHFPMQIMTNKLGEPYEDSANAFRYFQVVSNELSALGGPKSLICPADKKRKPANDFNSDFNSENISYFAGLDAKEANKTSLLAGDANLTNGIPSENGLMTITTNQLVGWTNERHRQAGNVALSDGSAQPYYNQLSPGHSMYDFTIQEAVQRTGLATNRLLMP